MQRRGESSGSVDALRGVIDRRDQLHFRAADQPARAPFTRVLMADPAYFDVEYVINPYMAEHVGGVAAQVAQRQWESLRDAYRGLGLQVEVIDGVPGLPDLVFIANQSMPVVRADGEVLAVRSHMWSPHRRDEVEVVAAYYEKRSIPTVALPTPDVAFEGMGDARWHPGRRLLYVGHGFRTERRVLDALSELAQAQVVGLRLRDPSYYHLDTCFCPLDEQTALYVPEAFDEEGTALLQALFPVLLPIPSDEAARLAGNGNCPDQKHLVLNAGNPQTEAMAREAGFVPIPVDTSEFLKSGGSVYCMTLMLP